MQKQPSASFIAGASFSRCSFFKRVSACVLMTALALLGGHAPAQSTWNTNSGTWGTAGSWSGGVPSSTGTAVFSGSTFTPVANLNGVATSIGTITISNTKGTTIENGNATAAALSIGSGGISIASGSGAVLLGGTSSSNAMNVDLTANQSWVNLGSNALVIDNTVTNTGAGNETLTIGNGSTTTGATTFTGAITDGSSYTTALTINTGAAVVTNLNNTNTYTGATTITAGTVTVGSAGSTSASSAVSIASGATVNDGGSIQGAISLGGTLNISGSTANTTGAISALGTTGVISYTNTYNSGVGNTLAFSGTGTFVAFTNTGTSNLLNVTGTGTSTFTNSFGQKNSTSSTNFQSGTYIFPQMASSTVGSVGTLTISGATVDFLGGRYFLGGSTTSTNNTVNISAGALNILNASGNNRFNFGDNVFASSTSVMNITGSGTLNTDNLTNGVYIGAQGTAQGNSGTASNPTSITINQSGASSLAQIGLTNYGGGGAGTTSLNIGDQNQTNGTAANYKIASYNLSNGTLRVNGSIQSGSYNTGMGMTPNPLGTGSSNNFNWTGGTLNVGGYNATQLTGTNTVTGISTTGTLIQNGGTLAPGYNNGSTQFTGRTAITGNYLLNSGTVAINIGSATASTTFGAAAGNYDNITVSGSATLGGTLAISLINGYTPTSTATFTILTAAKSTNSVTGSFTNLQTGKTGTGYYLTGTDGLTGALVTYTAGSSSVNGSVVVSGYNTASNNTYTGGSTSSWDAANAGSWSVFDPGSSSVGSAAAVFGTDSTGTINVSLGSSRKVQGIIFSSTVSGNNYVITPTSSGSITLDNTANAANAYITDNSSAGNQNTINGTITLNSNLTGSVTNASTVLTLGGNLSGTGTTALTKTGAGTLALLGANTYGGPTTISGGTLAASNLTLGGTVSSIGNSSNAAANLVLDGGTLQYTGSGGTTDRLFTMTANGATLDASGTGTITYSNTGAVVVTGSGTPTFTLTGTNTGANLFALVLGDGAGQTSLVKNGNGQWILTNANTFSGGTAINAGTLDVRNSSALGNTSGAVTVVGGAALTLDGSNTTIGQNITLNGTGTTANSGNLANLANSNTVSGTVYANAPSLITASGSTTLTLSGPVYAGNSGTDNALTFGSSTQSGTINVSGVIHDYNSSGGGVIVNGGLVTFSNTNATTAGESTTVNAGELDLNASGGRATGYGSLIVNGGIAKLLQSNQVNSTGTVTVSGTGVFNIQNYNDTVKGVTLTGGTIAGTTGTLTSTTAYAIQSGLVSASLSGTVGLNKTTSGTATFSGVGTYTGATTLAAGTLIATGTIASGSTVTVGNNTAVATLAGNGTISGSIVASSTGTNIAHIAPGATAGTAGTLHVGNLGFTIGVGTSLDYDLANTGLGTSDLITMSGGTLAFTGTGTVTLNVNELVSGALSGTYTLINGASSINLGSVTLVTSNTGTYAYNFINTGTALEVSFTTPVSTTSGTYTLVATPTSTLLHAGASTTVTDTITNTGTGTADSVSYTGLGTSSTGTIGGGTGSGTLAQGISGTNTQSLSTIAGQSGTITVTPVASATNTTIGGSANLASTTSGSVTVYSGQGVWATAGNGSWGTPSATQTAWASAGGVPGLDASFTTSDSASFGAISGSSSGTVTLGTSSPHLNTITFATAGGGYTLAQGSGGTGTFTLSNTGSNSATITDNSTGSANNIISAPIVLGSNLLATVTGTTATVTLSGTISGSDSITKAGAGKLILSGSNTYTGGTTLNAGILVATSSTTISGSVIASGPFGTGTLTLTGGTLDTNGGAVTLANALSLSGTITFGVSGTGGSLTFSGAGLTTSGTVSLANATTLFVNDTTTIADTINYGGNALTVAGPGTLYLTGNNSGSSGSTTVSTGTLAISSSTNLSTGTVNLASGTTLQYTGTTGTLTNAITITGTTGSTGIISNTGGQVLTLAGTIDKTATTLDFGSGKFVVSGKIIGNTGTPNSDVVLGTPTGSTTVGLTNTNTYNGPTTIYNGSTLLTGVSGALPTGTFTVLTLGASGDTGLNTLDLLGTSQTVAGIHDLGNSGVVNQVISSSGTASTATIGTGASSSPGTLTVNVASGTDTFGSNGGILGDSNAGTSHNANNFSLTKSGTGTLALTGANLYSGGTTIAAGTLIVSNSTGSATGTGGLTLNSGATLTGTGSIAATGNATIGGNVVVGNGGTTDVLHMTASGTINFSGANLTFNLDTNNIGNSSSIALGGTPTVLFGGTTLTINLSGTALYNTPEDYVLFSVTGSGTDVFSNLTFSNGYTNGSVIKSGFIMNITGTNAGYYSGTYLELATNHAGGFNIVAVIPEPSTWALMLGGLALLLAWQRIRRNKSS